MICVIIYEIANDIIDIGQTNPGNFWIIYIRLLLSRLASRRSNHKVKDL